jgi:Protein of unknown function (DUF1549)/Protein of unknown function (DUF1553)
MTAVKQAPGSHPGAEAASLQMIGNASATRKWLLPAAATALSALLPAGGPANAADAPPVCARFSVQMPSADTIIRTVSDRAELLAPSATATDGTQATARHRAARLKPPAFSNLIDNYTFARMKKDGISPTSPASDAEFLRRMTLDLTGQIPDPAAVQAFLADTSADKRTRAIDQLLGSDAYVDRWTMWFGDLVQNVQVAANSREFYVGRNAYYQWIHDSIKANKPYDQMVRELLSGSGDSFALTVTAATASGPATPVPGTPNYVVRQLQPNGPIQDTYDNLAAESAGQFLGQPALCLSCHNGFGHLELVNTYLSRRGRQDFWKMAAFFSRTAARGMPDSATNGRKFLVADSTTGAYQLNTTTGNKSPRVPPDGQPNFVTPAYLFTGEQPRPGEAWRDAYGRMLTADPQFARAAVNYVWKEMFGLGLVEPANNIDLARLDPSNLPPGTTAQPSNPDLLNALANYFQVSGYDIRGLLRLMATSSTYQLSSKYTPGAWNEAWTTDYPRHYPHRLMAEEVLDAIFKATGVGAAFTVNGIGAVSRAMLLPDTTEQGARTPYGQFLNSFGRGDRDQVARRDDSSISQALGLMNDPIVVSRIHQTTAGSTVAGLKTATDPATIVDALYMATLSRHPSAAESATAAAYLKGGNLGQRTEDLQFALLNSLEFLFN